MTPAAAAACVNNHYVSSGTEQGPHFGKSETLELSLHHLVTWEREHRVDCVRLSVNHNSSYLEYYLLYTIHIPMRTLRLHCLAVCLPSKKYCME